MSGGHFDYQQYKIGEIADSIEREIMNNGKCEREPYCDEVITQMKVAVNQLRIAEVYAQRVDWLLSGDDGEDSFIRRLGDELDAINLL